jgi:UDP-glucose 4-epimerase
MNPRRVVLVTGGAGFVGVPTVKRLVDRGFEVAVADNFAVGSASRLDPLVSTAAVSVHDVDLRDATALATLVGDVAPWGAIHLAALHYIPYCVANPAETMAVNVLGLQHLLDALGGTAVQRFVFASTGDVYRPSPHSHGEDDETMPTSIYGASKLTGEWMLRLWRASGSAAAAPVVARLFNVYGPGETNPHVIPHLCESMRRGDDLPLGNVDARRDYTYVDDVAGALVALLDSETGDTTVNVGAGGSWSVADIVEHLARLTGRNLRICVEAQRLRRSDRPELRADPSRLRSLVPGAVGTPLETGLRRLLEAEGLLGP